MWRLKRPATLREIERNRMRSSESSRFSIAVFAAVLSLPAAAIAQNADAEAQAAERANAAIAERYMTAVQTELTSGVDSKSAAVGQEVDARTKDAATLADGTTLPKGTKLVGRVIQVQAESKDQPFALLAITFDRAELKNGASVALRSAIRTIAPPVHNSAGDNAFAASGPVARSAPIGGGPMRSGGMGDGPAASAGDGPAASVGGGPIIPGGGGSTTGTRGGGAGGGLGDGQGGLGGSLPGQTTRTIGQRTGMTPEAGGGAGANMPVTKAGDTLSTAPRATALPGVRLSNSTGGANVSGMLMASGRNISLDSGTQITLGVISNQPRPAP
jgi:hypothetical protein